MLAMRWASTTVYHMHAQHCMTPYSTHSTQPGVVLPLPLHSSPALPISQIKSKFPPFSRNSRSGWFLFSLVSSIINARWRNLRLTAAPNLASQGWRTIFYKPLAVFMLNATSRVQHPLPHTHTLHTACQRTQWNCIPEIFLSEPPTGSRLLGVTSVNPRFTNNSLGLDHAHSLSVCLFLWVCVVCVCFLIYLSFYLCCAPYVFCVLFYIPNHIFAFRLVPFSTNLIETYATVPIDVRTTLPICLSSFSTCIFLSQIPAYVYLNMYTHFPPLPYSYTLIAIFICMVCVLFYTYKHLFVFFLLFLQI